MSRTILQKWLGIRSPHVEGKFPTGKLHALPNGRVQTNNEERWYQSGFLSRKDGPAIITEISEHWYSSGVPHRDYKPAITVWQSPQAKKLNNQIVEYVYYQYGELHRDDGPAIQRMDGFCEYWKKGKLHREDGPARIYPWSGSNEFWLNGIQVSESEYD